jgi:predicted Zn-dependent peptidase
MEKITDHDLSSGARIIHLQKNDTPLSYVSAWYHAGARFDPPSKAGLAHFFEHIYGTQTTTHPDKNELVKNLESEGIKFNAYTSTETAHFYYEQPQEQTETALLYLKEIIEETIIDPIAVEAEKNTILNEEKENRHNPSAYIWRLSHQALWPQSLMGNDFFGTIESIKSITKSDLEIFRKNYYGSENLSFIVASSQSSTEVGKILSSIDLEKNSDRPNVKENELTPPKKILVEKRDIEQTTIAIAFRTASIYETDLYRALDLGLHILVNSWISRVNQRLRTEENISYWPTGGTEHFSDTGYAYIQFTVKNEDTEKALSIVLEEISKLRNQKIPEVQLEKFKRSYISTILQNYETLDDVIWWYGWQATLGIDKLLSLDSYIAKINEISSEQLQQTVSTYLCDEHRSIIAVGNITEKELVNYMNSI